MLSKILIVVIFLGIIASMGSALFFLIKDKGQSNRTLHALTVRIIMNRRLERFEEKRRMEKDVRQTSETNSGL